MDKFIRDQVARIYRSGPNGFCGMAYSRDRIIVPSDKKQGKEEVYKLLWFNRMPFYTLNPNLEHRYSCISAVFPEFYIHVDSKHCSTFRLTGYKIKSIKTQELTNVHKSLLYIFGTVPGSDDGYTTKLLNPISREAE